MSESEELKKLTEPTTAITHGNFDQSKILDYGLQDQVLEWYLKGVKPHRIATLCNQELDKRKDKAEKNYLPINNVNVTYFLRTKQKEIEFSNNAALAPLNRKAIDVLTAIDETITTIKTEAEKLIHPDNPIQDSKTQFFIELIKQLNKSLELSANVQGKVQPSININIFQNNIKNFTDKIMASPDISNETKQLIIRLVTEELINDNLLKTVQGEVKG